MTNLEEQLSAEAQERMLAAKANRKLVKKIKELLMQLLTTLEKDVDVGQPIQQSLL